MAINYKKNLIYLSIFLFIFISIFKITVNGLNMQSHFDNVNTSALYMKQYENIKHSIFYLLTDREFKYPLNSLDDRKRLRYLYKSKVEFPLYSYIYNKFSPTLFFVTYIFHYSIIIFLSLVFIIKSLNISNIEKLLVTTTFLVYFSYFLFTIGIAENYTIIEMFAISLAIFSSLKKKPILFLLALMIAISNRESGILVSLIYPIVNYDLNLKNIIKLSIFPLIGFLFFVGINIDILTQEKFWHLNMIIPTKENVDTHLSFFNMENFSIYSIVRQFITIFLIYLLLFFVPYNKLNINAKKLLIVLAIYILMLFIASPLADVYPHFIVIPLIFYIFFSGINKLNIMEEK